MQPLLIRLSDLFGRRSVLVVSLALFTLGTIICCVAQNFTVLIAGRSVQGAGGGGCVSLTVIIITEIFPLRYRASYQSFLAIAWAVGTLLGPYIGGIFAETTTWRWCFYLNFPFLFIAIIMATTMLRLESTYLNLSLATKLGLVDWIGAFLFMASTTSFLTGLTWAGSQYSWVSSHILVPMALGVTGLAATIIWEIFGSQEPFLRLKLFRTKSANAGFFSGIVMGLVVGAIQSLSLFMNLD